MSPETTKQVESVIESVKTILHISFVPLVLYLGECVYGCKPADFPPGMTSGPGPRPSLLRYKQLRIAHSRLPLNSLIGSQ